MDQLAGGGGGHQNQHQQQQQGRRRGLEVPQQQQQNPQQQQQPPPQLACPRCQSNNTKFCYYNNYSLTQPRYFCKGCRRYWTHGGTLRNVPVGGGCRKSKRPKLAEPAAGQQHQQHHHLHRQQQQQQQQAADDQKSNIQSAAQLPTNAMGANLGLVSNMIGSSSSSTLAPPMIGPLYPGYGGGFLSSLAAIHTMNQPKAPPPFSQPLGGGADLDSPLLQGFALPSFGILQQAAAAARPSGAAASNHHQEWQQQGGLMGNVNQLGRPPGSDARFWSIGSSSGSSGVAAAANNNNNSNGNHVGSSAANQWPDFSGCGLDDA
ncbi:hypothetical protein Dimus_032735 [Dionaea muscipula]